MEDQQHRQRAQQQQQHHQHQQQQQKDLFAFFSSPSDNPAPSSSGNSQSSGSINQHPSMPIPGISAPVTIPLFPFAPASPPTTHPLSTSPLTMSMLTNLMQNIQSMDNQPSSSSSSNIPQNNSSSSQQSQYSPQALLEHQFKITQLQQLQQLQNQIFQQQIALISGQSPPLLPGSPVVPMDGTASLQRGDQGSFTGLPTPGPSSEIRPTQPTPMDFVSPMVLSNSFLDTHAPSSSTTHPHPPPHSHSHSQSQAFREHSFSSPHVDHSMTAHSASHSRNHHHAHSFDLPHSAPEHIAFRTSPGRDLDIDISPLTSPWLGAHSTSSSFHSKQTHTHLQPLRAGAGSKRPPSSSGDESSAPSRKKPQSPAIRAQNPNPSSSSTRSRRLSKSTTSTPLLRSTRGSTSREFTSIGEVVGDTPSPVDLSMPPPAPPAQQPSLTPINTNTNNMGYTMPMSAGGTTSKPANGINHSSGPSSASEGTIPNTPVSPAFDPSGTSFPGNTGDSGQFDTQMDTSFPNTSSPAFDASSPAFGATTPSNVFIGTSSPAFGATSSTFNSNAFGGAPPFPQPGSQAMGGITPAPATPASMMNLGRLGTSSGLTPPQGRTAVEKAKSRSATVAASGKGKKSGVGTSPGLKAILPAGPTAPSQLSDPSPLPGPVLTVKKTSHKHAEQKRRDSLKTTFDDLRQLLPPIPLPNEPDTPILPGALPPRGPPKAGADGPNKGVSKLQLLICGNEYIRTLKSRVDRRDEEIQKLRKEVGRLRGEVERLKGIVGEDTAGNTGEDEQLDLEKDLDAVEALRPSFGRLGMMGGEGQDDDDGDD